MVWVYGRLFKHIRRYKRLTWTENSRIIWSDKRTFPVLFLILSHIFITCIPITASKTRCVCISDLWHWCTHPYNDYKAMHSPSETSWIMLWPRMKVEKRKSQQGRYWLSFVVVRSTSGNTAVMWQRQRQQPLIGPDRCKSIFDIAVSSIFFIHIFVSFLLLVASFVRCIYTFYCCQSARVCRRLMQPFQCLRQCLSHEK